MKLSNEIHSETCALNMKSDYWPARIWRDDESHRPRKVWQRVAIKFHVANGSYPRPRLATRGLIFGREIAPFEQTPVSTGSLYV